jgi:hypothetical protein
MRTKTLLLAAALSAAGFATSLAQSNVYSLNVVGYINVPTPTNGFYFIANQLHNNSTGTGNTIESVLGTNHPNGTRVFAYTPAGVPPATYQSLMNNGVWLSPANVNLNGLQAGQGVVYQKVTGGPDTITMVGEVLQGALNNTVVAGIGIKSSMVPQAGLLTTDLGLQLANVGVTSQDTYQAYNWVGGSGPFTGRKFINGNWIVQPNISVGESFWLSAAAGATWLRNFTVQ